MNQNPSLSLIEELDYFSHILYPSKRKPKTTNNQQCITDCKFPGDTIYHPQNNLKIIEYNQPFCATDTWYNDETKNLMYHDTCNYTNTDLMAWSEIDSSNFIPLTPNNCEALLTHMHNIQSWEDALKWEQNTLSNEVIRKRVLNCAWKAFAPDDKTSEEYISSVVDKYHSLMNNEWKKYMHDGLDINFPTHLRKKEVKNEIDKILSDKKLIKLMVNNYRKKKNLGWLTLKFYDEKIKQFCIQEIKSIL